MVRKEDKEKNIESFGFQWVKHKTLDSQFTSLNQLYDEFYYYGIKDHWIKDKSVLDAGCGMGRYSLLLSLIGAKEVYGFDLHDGIEAAKEFIKSNKGDLKNIHLQKGDIFDPPFKDKKFDLIVSYGVLMATGNTRKALHSLVQKLKPGGKIHVMIYKKRNFIAHNVNRFITAITSRMKPKSMYNLMKFLVYLGKVPIYAEFALLMQMIGISLPSSSLLLHLVRKPKYKKKEDKFLPTERAILQYHDWYCRQYEFFTEQETVRMFKNEGLVNIYNPNKNYRHCVVMVGEKPKK